LARLLCGCLHAATRTARVTPPHPNTPAPPHTQIYFYFYSLLRAAVVSHNRRRRGLPPVTPGSVAARREDIGVPASLGVAAVAGVVNMVLTSPAQVLGTQMQAASTLKRQLEARGQASASIRSDTAGVAASLWREGGPAAFWKGEAGWGGRWWKPPHAAVALPFQCLAHHITTTSPLPPLNKHRSGPQPAAGVQPSAAVHGV
jgi:hypothetical protein